jgi:predicted short-subunit dehydrogenase-like oxidoreductase (DUF2520 family)
LTAFARHGYYENPTRYKNQMVALSVSAKPSQAQTPTALRLNVLGCGRVGTTLAALWQRAGLCQVQQFYSRSVPSAMKAARFVGAGAVVTQMAEQQAADVWMLSVPDSQVEAVAQALATLPLPSPSQALPQTRPQPPTVFHCSGFLSSVSLAALATQGWQVASAHPVFNFADPAQCVDQFAGTPCGLEGDAAATALLHSLLTGVGGSCFPVDAQAKPLYHAAAVFSSNFMAVLQAVAREAWHAAGVPEALIPDMHRSLLQGSVQNLLTLGPAKAITGPAARGDSAVVSAQAERVMQWHPEAAELYQMMSVLARRLATTGATTPATQVLTP